MNPSVVTRRAAVRQRGITLIECAVALAIVTVAAGAALPALKTLRTQLPLIQAAAGFETDVQHARALAVAANTPWRITFGSLPGRACYVVHTGGADDCRCDSTGPAQCTSAVQAHRTVSFDANDVWVQANVTSVVFDPVKGTSTPAGTVRFQARDGAAVHQIINVMGRVRSCSPGRSVPGYKAC